MTGLTSGDSFIGLPITTDLLATGMSIETLGTGAITSDWVGLSWVESRLTESGLTDSGVINSGVCGEILSGLTASVVPELGLTTI